MTQNEVSAAALKKALELVKMMLEEPPTAFQRAVMRGCRRGARNDGGAAAV